MTKHHQIDGAATGGGGSKFWNFRQVNPARTLTFCAIGALAGLGIAGYGLFTATGTTTAIYPAANAAMVNDVPILMVDFVSQIRALYDVPLGQATRAQKTRALDDLVREELYVQRGLELGLPNDDTDVRTALVGAAEAQTVSEQMTTVPSQAELTGYYLTNRDRYSSEGTMAVTDWIVTGGDGIAAQRAADALHNGTSPQTLGLVAGGEVADTEQFYFAARIHLGGVLFDAAKKMRDGAISAPIQSGGKLHILVMRRNTSPVPAAFEAVKARVVADYMEDVKKKALSENTKFLRERARISFAPMFR